MRRRTRIALVPLMVTAGALTAAGAAASATVAVARRAIAPEGRRPDDVAVLAVPDGGTAITLQATPDALLPGRYSFWFDGDTGCARLGEVLAVSGSGVVRALERVDFGVLRDARAGRLSGWYYLRPEEVDPAVVSVAVPTEGGEAPAWLFRHGDGATWAIHVHGRGAARQEALRAVPTFTAGGYTSLVVSYRNDPDAPASRSGRYGLGATEWRDVDAAVEYAIRCGAERIVLMGWSMGGAIVLQVLARSLHAGRIVGVALDSPVVDWADTLGHQARLLHIPTPIAHGAMRLLDEPWSAPLTGADGPIDLGSLDFVARADELNVPILLLHSVDDDFVPASASQALAAKRPDLVTYVPFRGARHTRLWNVDPKRWNDAISGWLGGLSEERPA